MPIFDIEGMAKKELDKVQEVRKKMRAFLESGKIEEWCARHPVAAGLVKDDVDADIRRIDRYRLVLADLLDGYRAARSAESFDKWEANLKDVCDEFMCAVDKDENIKDMCDDIMRDEDKTESDPREGD